VVSVAPLSMPRSGARLAGRQPKPNRAAADAASGPRLRRDPETLIKSSIDSIENMEGNQ
jgi:hypothetical protein